MSGKFSAEEDERLIDLVRLNPLLYTMRRRSNKDSQIKGSIWQLIASNIGRSEKECKIRWKIMRDYYQRRRKEAKLSDSTISFGGKLSSLKFLDSIKRKNSTNTPTQKAFVSQPTTVNQPDQPVTAKQPPLVNQPTVANEPVVMTQTEIANHRIFVNQAVVETKQDTLSPKVEQSQYNNNESTAHNQQTNRSERKRKRYPADLKEKMYKEIVESRHERLEILRRLSQQPDELLANDPNSLFFQSIKASVDKFPIHLQSQAKLKILQIVGDIELQSAQEISMQQYSGYSVASTSQSFFPEDSSNQVHTEGLQMHSEMNPNFNKLNNGSPK